MDVQIHLANSENLESILELQASSMKLLVSDLPSKGYNNRQIESLIRSQKSMRLKLDEIILVAYSQSRLVGFASLLPHTPEIGAVFVHPNFLRLGIGTKLLTSLENLAIKRKWRTLYVTAAIPAVGFYQASGYRRTHKSGFWSEGKVWIPCVNMNKRLIPPSNESRWTKLILCLIVCLVVFYLLLQFI